MSKFFETLAKREIDNPIILDGIMRNLMKCEEIDPSQHFLESIDIEKLGSEDKIRIYKKTLALLNRGTKSLAKFGAKVEKQNRMMNV